LQILFVTEGVTLVIGATLTSWVAVFVLPFTSVTVQMMVVVPFG
jgi:hypothetical protein